MCKFNPKNDGRRIDPCMRLFIQTLNILMKDIQTLKIVACCCGHRKYPMTIVMNDILSGKSYDLVSSKTIPRLSRFYKKDKKGYYYIPEVSHEK